LYLLYAPVAADASRRAVRCDCLAHRYGNAADRPERRAVYPTDLTDGQWAVIAPLIPVPAWIGGRGGRPEGYCHREMIDAMLYVNDNGTKWRALPVDFPPFMWNLICQVCGDFRTAVLRSIAAMRSRCRLLA
jgi:transposase